MDSPKGKIARYKSRKHKRLHLVINDIEPAGKKGMSDQDKDAFQREVIDQLEFLARRAFQGPLVLQMDFDTTGRTPSHAHTISKNILDLLSKPRKSIRTKRKHLVFRDDNQIHVLSVTCQHGNARSKIYLTARPLRDLVEDSQFAMRAEDELSRREMNRLGHSDSIEDLRETIRDRGKFISRFGEENYNSWLNMQRMYAQEEIFGRTKLRAIDVGVLYSAGDYSFNRKSPYLESMREMWERVFQQAPLRIVLSELPQKDGASSEYVSQVKSKIGEFTEKYDWIISPLRIPLALEVFVKPGLPRQARGLHDLDNVLRDYLIPRIVEVFEPPSHYLFAARNNGTDSLLTDSMKVELSRLPASTRIGLTRIEAWRLPRAKGDASPGFVSMAVVADQVGFESVLWKIDKVIEDWEELAGRRS